MKILSLILLLAVLCLPALSEEQSTLHVRKIENLPDDFIFGMDASSVISLEDSGVKYYDFDGNEEDVFKVLADSGITHIRVRIWNHPYNMAGMGYGGGNNDIEKAVLIGQRATKYGMKLIVNFHYSDFWADPANRWCPSHGPGWKLRKKPRRSMRTPATAF